MTVHRERLAGVHPRLVEAVEEILPVMRLLGHPMFIVEGVRTRQRQQELFAQGRTAPGAIVTHVDGFTVRGAHQVNPDDGYGHAVDLAFLGDDPWNPAHPWAVYGALVQWFGLRWGGAFSTISDKPHMEGPSEPPGHRAADGGALPVPAGGGE